MNGPEPFTSGLVSPAARRLYLADNPSMAGAFRPARTARARGYRMAAYASQIATARAMGRGYASGAGRRGPHPFDIGPVDSDEWYSSADRMMREIEQPPLRRRACRCDDCAVDAYNAMKDQEMSR